MSDNIGTYYVQQHNITLQLLLQQRGSKLRGKVATGNHVGEKASPVDQAGSLTANKVTARNQPITLKNIPTDRRWVYSNDYDLAQAIDSFDKLKMIVNAESPFTMAAMYAMGRAYDNEIIDAFFGTAKTGVNGSTSTTFPAGNVIAVNHDSSSNTGLTAAKLKEAATMAMANEVDLEFDQLWCAITANQHGDLLNEIQVISRDYNETPVIQSGKITSLFGINFVHTELLDVDSNSYRKVPVWAQSGMYLGMWQEPQSRLSIRNDLTSEPIQIYTKGSFGATRLEEKKVFQILCAE